MRGKGITIRNYKVRDIRFPTSLGAHGSDAMNKDPDYSAAYLILKTDDSACQGHGLAFTIGRGNDLCCAALRQFSAQIVGMELAAITEDFGGFWKHLNGDSQIRWLGPDKGVVHMALGALINAIWDLYAKVEGKPLWRLVAEMRPEQILKCVDLSYLGNALSRAEALELLESAEAGKAVRIEVLERSGYPAYTTSVGWLGYSDERIQQLCREAVSDGWTGFKMKVGADLQDDLRRAQLIRAEIGADRILMMDANQKWEVAEAIANMRELAVYNPLWIEEPTHPDDVLGHAEIARAVQPIKVATGEHCANRILFKQFLQAEAMGVCQIDACRVGGLNENLAILLLAAKYGVPVCPHAGGVGLCEYVQHLSMLDFVAISGKREGRMLEYVDHLHEHFVDPVRIHKGCYQLPRAPGFSIEMKPESLARFDFENGSAWK